MTLGKKIKFITSKHPSSKFLKGNFVILEPINIEKHCDDLFECFALYDLTRYKHN